MRRFPLTFLALLMIIAVGAGFGLRADSAEAQSPRSAPGGLTDVIIAFDSAPGASQEALVRAFGGTVSHTYQIVPAIAATVPQGAVQGLQNHPSVARVELDGEVHLLDHVATTSDAELEAVWGVEHIGAGTVHAGGNAGAGVKVGVIDTGIDYKHPDLAANYAGGYNFVKDNADPLDDNGHGSHVSGTIAAADDGAGVVGVAPEADLYALKVLNRRGSGRWSDIIAALDWATGNNTAGDNNTPVVLDVVNLSLGSSGDPGATVRAAFDNAAGAGLVIVASAGNRGSGDDTVGYPAHYSSVIAVASTTSSDARSSFSSTGPDVEIAAPGSSVYSTYKKGAYKTLSGTSMAAPHVTGTVALMISAGAAPGAVRGDLGSTAIDLGTPGRDPEFGFGLVDPVAATNTAPPNDSPVVSITSPTDGDNPASGDSISFVGSASDTEDEDLTASLSWSSDLEGAIIGSGGSFSATLSDGVHTITASVTDSGAGGGSASLTITVGTPPNVAPAVSITAPADGSSSTEGDSVTFTATATDLEDGDLSASLGWSSDLDGVIGAGASFSATLSVGTHTITASVTDSGGLPGSDSISVTVNAAPAPGTTVSVDSIVYSTSGGKKADKHLNIALSLSDDLDGLVAGASVAIELFRDGTLVGFGTALTDEFGTVVFSLKNAKSGTYTTEVTGVTADGLTWDGSYPDNSFDK